MRLIDADALKTKMLDYYSYSWQLREEIGDFFDNAPVVLEFDEEITKVVVKGEEYCKRTQWISCSERLPEIKEGHESDTVLCYTDMEAYAFSRLQENIFGQCGFECEREDEYYTSVGKVIAWMPLPEPCGGDSNDNH